MLIVGITNRKLCEDFYDQIKRISKTNLDYLIIREKDLSDEELLMLALKVKNELKDTNIKIIINSNIDVAKKVNADGVQLSFKNFMDINNKLCTENILDIKNNVDNFKFNGKEYRMNKMIGVSIHNYDEAIQSYKLGADYVIYGHVFQTDCKKGLSPRGVNEIKDISKKISIPVIGIGGIDESNFEEVIDAGAKGIAIMSSLMKNKNPNALIKSMSK